MILEHSFVKKFRDEIDDWKKWLQFEMFSPVLILFWKAIHFYSLSQYESPYTVYSEYEHCLSAII